MSAPHNRNIHIVKNSIVKKSITKTTFRMPTQFYSRVRIQAIKEGITVVDLVLKALKEYLERNE